MNVSKMIKNCGIMILIFTLMVQTVVYGAVDTTVNITKNDPVVVLTDEGERIFDIEYVFDVDYQQVLTGLDLVIVLDRSNSMLREDPSTGLPVADAVWGAVNEFVTEVYTAYPESNLAIVSFGTNANKSDNWKYYNNLEDTLHEINEVYEYRDLYTNYNSNFKSFWYNGYRYAWENWQISDGATNISAAFEYGETTVWQKEIHGFSSGQDVMILFTDGVATQGGSNSQKNYNYPTSHNSNTIAAYEAGIAAQVSAEIITVGYFEGIEYESTKTVARETLELSQNAGFFEASQTDQLTGIFDTIVEELNYIGTDATVVEIIEDEFEVVPGSIEPEGYTLSTDGQGRQVITWQLGNVIDTNYSFGYQVKVKDDVYPTGSGTLEIPINQEAMLYYTDLDGSPVAEPLGQSFTTIPPRNNQPQVEVDITYLNNQYGYLVGDEISIDHALSFINELPYDYRGIAVNQFNRSLVSGNLSEMLTLSEESQLAGWNFAGNDLSFVVNDSHQVTGLDNLEWSTTVPIKLITNAVGNYQLNYNVDYVLTNSLGTTFDFLSIGQDPDVVDVKDGQVILDLSDNVGIHITEVEAYVDGVAVTTEVNEDNYVVIGNIPSGSHTISFLLPSGYVLLSSGNGISMDESNMINFDVNLSYDSPVDTKIIEFERLNVKDIIITTRGNSHSAAINQTVENVDGKLSFTLTRPLTKVSLNIVDDFASSNHGFVLDLLGSLGDVRDENGDIVSGFEMNGNKLEYDGSQLPIGTYTAYGQVLTPSTLGDGLDYDYNIDVDEIITRELGDPMDTVSAMTSLGLYVGLVDDEGPVIESIHDEEASTLNLINQDIRITDKTTIVTYEIYNGTLTYEEILVETEVLSLEVIEDLDNSLLLDADIPVELTIEPEGYVTSGSITIYAVDAFGNYSLLVVEYENTDINDLLDEDLV